MVSLKFKLWQCVHKAILNPDFSIWWKWKWQVLQEKMIRHPKQYANLLMFKLYITVCNAQDQWFMHKGGNSTSLLVGVSKWVIF